jgi:glycosyltransferase involved in cell wall biosynthesis
MEDRARISVGEPLSLSLVIPLFNERENIRKVVIPIIRTLEPFVDSYELILVDNGSRDGTRREIEALGAEFPNAVPVPIDENQGYGGGILSGLDAARGEFPGYLAEDGQIPAPNIIKVGLSVHPAECLGTPGCESESGRDVEMASTGAGEPQNSPGPGTLGLDHGSSVSGRSRFDKHPAGRREWPAKSGGPLRDPLRGRIAGVILPAGPPVPPVPPKG